MNKLLIRQQHSKTGLVQRVADVSLIALTMYTSQWIVRQPINMNTSVAILASSLLFLLCGEVFGIYRGERIHNPGREIAGVLSTWTTSLLVLFGLAFFTRTSAEFARSSTLGWIVLGAASIALTRMLIRIGVAILMRNGWGTRRCAIVGLNQLGLTLQDNIVGEPSCGLHVIGFFDDRTEQRCLHAAEQRNTRLGKLDELLQIAKAGQVDTVFVALPMRAESRIRWLLDQLADTTASVYIVPDFFVFELLHSRWNTIGGLPVVSVFETPLYGVDGWVKRAFDFTAALAGVIIISPILLTCMILVRYSSPGPIFFRQRRYGLDGKEIWVWKFRSMRTCDNGPVVQQATKNDPRITPIGAILRRTSLDELPQLFNVLEGTMSLVGPRPHASAHNEHYRKLIKGYMLRHKVRPGITGLAQVEGFRGETETLDKMQKRVEFDHRYIREWSLWLDIRILLKTFTVVFKQETAY
jgi:putative colanic acid biosysnthesis UDP-glucose lipid carrier transferase